MQTSFWTRTLWTLGLPALLAACTGDGTLAEVDDRGMDCDPDAGLCDEGGGGEADVVRLDCCTIETEVERTLCDDLYGGTLPEGLVVEDTCDMPPGGEGGEGGEGGGGGGEDGPCAGLSGLEAVFCEVTSLFGGEGGGEDDPCAGLEGTDALLCSFATSLGVDTTPTPPAEGPLADLVNGINALADIANGLNALAELLGLADLLGGLTGDGAPADEQAGEATPDVEVQ